MREQILNKLHKTMKRKHWNYLRVSESSGILPSTIHRMVHDKNVTMEQWEKLEAFLKGVKWMIV